MFNVLQLRKLFGPLVKAAPKRPKPRPTFKPRLEVLEDRWCPDATTDVLIWNPVGNSMDPTQSANWFDQTQNMQNLTAPTPTNPIVLDGSQAGYNKPIEFKAAMPVASLTVQNGYFNTLIIDKGATLTTTSNDIVKNGCTLTVTSSDVDGIAMSNNNNFTVAAGGTLNLRDPMGATAGAGFLYAVQKKPGEYVNNAGTITWQGTSVAAGKASIQDAVNAPVLNTGTFSADGGTGGDITRVAATLAISGQDAKTNNVTVYQTAGTFTLTNSAIVTVDTGYSQSGGSLTTGPTGAGPSCQLSAGDTGDINIAGGKVVVDTTPNSYGSLKFVAATVEINAEVDLNGLTMMGGKSTQCDLLDCSTATVTLGVNSFLNVGTTGGAPLGTGNQWVVMKYKSLKNAWGKITVPPTMGSSVGATQILVSN